MNEKEMAAERKAELEAAKAATDRESIVELGCHNFPNFHSVYYKTDSGESTVVRFKHQYNATRLYWWIDEHFAD